MAKKIEIEDEEAIPRGISNAMLGLIVAISFAVLAMVFLYIFLYTGWGLNSRFYWSGFVAFVIAVIYYFIHASTEEKYVTRQTSAALFALGVVFFYVSIYLSEEVDEGSKLLGYISLSIVLIIVLALAAYMLRDKARQARRMRLRKRT